MRRAREVAVALVFTLIMNGIGILLLVRVQSMGEPDRPTRSAPVIEPVSLRVAAPPPPPEHRPDPDPVVPRRRPRAMPLAIANLPSAIQARDLVAPEVDLSGFTQSLLSREAEEVSGLASLIFAEDEVDEPPVPLRQVAPEYPFSARELDIEGRVVVRVHIDREGEVVDARVVSADPPKIFDRACLKAIRKWRWRPGRYRGQAVALRVEVPFSFTLTGELEDRPSR